MLTHLHNLSWGGQTIRPFFHVGIVGAGIGGLAAAIAFSRAGVNVTVLEAADELLEVSQPACHVNGEYHP